MGSAVFLQNYAQLDHGQVSAQFYDLFPGREERPLDANPDQEGTPLDALKLLYIAGSHFVPVERKMWLGVNAQYNSGGQLMVPLSLSRAGQQGAVNQWRHDAKNEIDGEAPNLLNERFSWEVAGYRGQTMGHRVDRALRDQGGTGFFDPFVVEEDPNTGLPRLASTTFFASGMNVFTLWRRTMRLPEGAQPKSTAGHHGASGTENMAPSETYAENATVVVRAALIWRETAEQILRATGAVPAGEEIDWVWYRSTER